MTGREEERRGGGEEGRKGKEQQTYSLNATCTLKARLSVALQRPSTVSPSPATMVMAIVNFRC